MAACIMSSGVDAVRSTWTSQLTPPTRAWFTMATGDDLNDTLERAAHQALIEFCELHLPGLDDTAVTLFPVQN
jgi:hypothetical protein